MAMANVLLFLCALAPAHALRATVPTPPTAKGVSSSSAVSRKALLGNAAAAVLGLTFASPAAFAKEKGYMTMDEYNALKRKEQEDEKLYGLFESLRSRAAQTGEFDNLAKDEKYGEISKLALAWDSTIRQQLLDKANEKLSGDAKTKGSAISKALLADLKELDKLAKTSNKDGVPTVSASVRSKVEEFVALEPSRLTDKFGIGDL